MSTTERTSPQQPGQTVSRRGDGAATTAAAALSVRRLNVMRVGYLVVAVGLAVTKWPLLINRSEPWPLMEGVATYMLVAMGLLAFLGLRHPVEMLPILLFESAWKLLWLAAVALPLWAAGDMDAATREVASASLWVVIVLAVIPWRYVVGHYLARAAEPWRSAGGGRPRSTKETT